MCIFYPNSILDSSLDDTKVRVQDTVPLMMTLVKLGGRKQVWRFIEKNFDGLAERLFLLCLHYVSLQMG